MSIDAEIISYLIDTFKKKLRKICLSNQPQWYQNNVHRESEMPEIFSFQIFI